MDEPETAGDAYLAGLADGLRAAAGWRFRDPKAAQRFAKKLEALRVRHGRPRTK